MADEPKKPVQNANATKPKSRTALWIVLGVMIGCVALVPVIGPLALVELYSLWARNEKRKIERLKARLDDHWVFYETTVAFTAEGQRFTLRASFACQPEVSGMVGKPRIKIRRVVPSHASFRLPSGAGLIFSLPGHCTGPNVGEFKSNPELKPKRITIEKPAPEIMWLDNADAPQVIEKYVSDIYFASTSPRVRVHAISIRPLPRAGHTDTAKEIGWLKEVSWRRSQCGSGRCGPAFSGLQVIIIPRGIWKSDRNISETLSKVTKSELLPRQVSVSISRYLMRGDFPVDEDAQPKANQARRPELVRPTAFPVVIEKNRYRIDFDRPGMIVQYRLPPGNDERRLLGQRVPDGEVQYGWRFDPRTQTLFALRRSDLYRIVPRLKNPAR